MKLHKLVYPSPTPFFLGPYFERMVLGKTITSVKMFVFSIFTVVKIADKQQLVLISKSCSTFYRMAKKLAAEGST
jgi:hypothetical protein